MSEAIGVLLRIVLSAALPLSAAVPNFSGKSVDPFADPARARVFLFVRSDCPITNRYAPELARIASEFSSRGVAFWLVYEDSSETAQAVNKHIADYHLPGTALRDPQHVLSRRAHATVAPEAAVFDATGNLIYHGRIDDRYVDIGKARPAPQVHDLEDAISAVLSGRPVVRSETKAVGCALADVQ
jgi:hypothetical protein